MKEDSKDLDQIAEVAIQDLREAIQNYIKVFSEKTKDSKKFLTIDQMEEMIGKLDAETRKIYLEMFSDSLNAVDEKELISSKKQNLKKGE